MARKQQEVSRLGPGWHWVYTSSEEHKGKHFQGPQGQELSVRQGQAVQRGEQTLEEALIKTYEVKDIQEVPLQNANYLLTTFGNLNSAILYAGRSNNTSFIVGYGKLQKGQEYPTDDPKDRAKGMGYRALNTNSRANVYRNPEEQADLFANSARKFLGGPTQRYIVWERIS